MTDKLYFGATTTCRLNDQPNTFMCTKNICSRFLQLLWLGVILTAINASAATATFRQGVSGYLSAVDTYVRSDQAATSFGATDPILVDRLSPLSHGLLRFENIVGNGVGQVPPGSLITSATLTLNVVNLGNAIQFYRMRDSWSGASTWDSLAGGITADGSDAFAGVEAQFTPSAIQVYVVDVTTSVQIWANLAAPNLGWALLPTGDDGVQFNSSENATATVRPLLTINYTTGVTNPIVITTQPQDQAVSVGATATFQVSHTGNPATYQWYRAGILLPNATNNFYTVVNAQNSDVSTYRVVISNSLGSVTSRDALLAVTVPPFQLFGLTNYTWKYESSGTDLGTDWRTTNYNDSAWSTGRGILAYENDGTAGGGINATIATLTNTVLPQASLVFPTRYFRTSFVFTNDPVAFFLSSSNYVDDGMVIYLNGQEAARYNMPEGPATYNTLAVAANPAGEGVFIRTNLLQNLVRLGTNVIAVEVHQNSTTSTDVDFGMALFVNALPPTTLSITSQPQSIVVNESQQASFSVGVQGAPAYFRWYKDGVAISNATFNPFVISITTTNDAGSYFVVASNSINSVTSSVATLTIIPDTNAPVLLAADGTGSLTNVLVTFSERITSATAQNTNNYRITNTVPNQVIGVISATLVDGTNVVLHTQPRAAGSNYILVVNRLTDIGPRANVIATNSSLPITSLLPIIGLGDAGWRFYNPAPEGGDVSDLGTAWKEFTYTEVGTWANGSSIFWNGDSDAVPGPIGVNLSQTEAFTSYYRKSFSIPQLSPGGLGFSLTHVIDDGGVMYLNGQEIFRFNMPSGPIAFDTRAQSTINPVARLGPVALSVASGVLRSGANLLAFELHTRNQIDVDKYFGMQLDAKVQSFVVGPVVITRGPTNVTTFEGATASFEAIQAGGATFQWRSNGVSIAGATNPIYTIPSVTLAMNGAQYQVAISNSTSFAISTNATLTVLPDTNAPALVSAFITTNGTVLVSFSEAVSTASATVLSNYRITNSAGANIGISGAVVSNNTNVILTVAGLPANTYTLIVSNVQDRSLTPNTISPNPSIARIGYLGPLTILDFAGTWRYDQSGTDLGTAWRAIGYNDSAWSIGQSLFADEDGALPEPIRTPLTLGPPTYYFRTLTNAPTGGSRATLRIRTLLDDGAIFYLNGVEILRVRLTAGAVINFGTFAANADPERVYEIFDVVVTNLVAGQNLLAVEVHNTSATSSDIVFGAEVTVLQVDSTIVSAGLQINSQPQSRTNAVGTTATFTVGASGVLPIYYQWRKGGVNLLNETNATLAVPNVQLSDNGNAYSVVVTNSTASLTSLVATLTVTNGGGGSCTIPSFWLGTNELRQTVSHPSPNATTIVLVWNNPINSCGTNAVVVLQRTTGLLTPPSSTVWTNVFTNTFGTARVTNTVIGTNTVFYRLRAQ